MKGLVVSQKVYIVYKLRRQYHRQCRRVRGEIGTDNNKAIASIVGASKAKIRMNGVQLEEV